MKILFKKLKKTKLSCRLVYYFVTLIMILSYIFLFRSISLFKGVETLIRILILVVLGIINIIYLIGGLVLLLTKKKKSLYALSFIIIVFSAIAVIISLLGNKTFDLMKSLRKEKVTYYTSLVLLKDTEFKNDRDFKVGIIKDKNEVDYIIGKEIIEDNNLKVTVNEYDTNFELLDKLYNKELDGILITSNYVLNFNTYDSYTNIEEETKVQFEASKEMKNQETTPTKLGSVDEPFTVLLMGVDSPDDTLDKNAAFNGDTLMVLAFNPRTLNATIFSIPRDTYAPIYNNKNKLVGEGKINSSAGYGALAPVYTVENFLGIKMDYTVKINFRGVIDLVNNLGGIDIYVEKPDYNSNHGYNCKGMVCESNSNRQVGNNLVFVPIGYQHLNGEQALAYARNRHQYAMSDFTRVQHQQVVIEGIANAAKNLSSLEDFLKVFDSISKNIDTNMEVNDILALYNTFKTMLVNAKTGSMINIQKTFLSGYDLYVWGEKTKSNRYTFQYYEDSLNDIVDALKITLEKKNPKQIKTFSFSANKTYETKIIGQGNYSSKKKEVLPDFTKNTLEYAKTYCQARGINYSIEYETNTELEENSIIRQSVHSNTLVSKVNSITITVAKQE